MLMQRVGNRVSGLELAGRLCYSPASPPPCIDGRNYYLWGRAMCGHEEAVKFGQI